MERALERRRNDLEKYQKRDFDIKGDTPDYLKARISKAAEDVRNLERKLKVGWK